MATILTHPKLGDRTFDDGHARKLMSLVNNGGWEFKKPSVGAAKSPRFSKKDDAAANTSADTGEVTIPEEKGDN
jgi:hypothetical protein